MSDIGGFDPRQLPPHKQEEFFVATHNELEIVKHIIGDFSEAKSAFIRMGIALYYARQKYGPRSEGWGLIRERLPFSKSTITKLVAIGADERIRQNDVFPHLPDSWGTIYLITRLTDAEIYAGINGGDINPEASRQEVSRYVRDCKSAGGPPGHYGKPSQFPPGNDPFSGLDKFFYDDLEDRTYPNAEYDTRRPDEDDATWSARVLWWNQEIKKRTRPLFNVRIDFNRIDYENARKAISISKQLRELPHVYTAEVNEFAIRRLEDRALDEFVKRMDLVGEIVSNFDGDPIQIIEASLKGDDRKLLPYLDATHPLLTIIREEFDTRVLGKEPRTPMPLSLRARMSVNDPFWGDEYGSNWQVMLRWIQAFESDDREDWEKLETDLDAGLTTEDVFDSPLDAGLGVSDNNDE